MSMGSEGYRPPEARRERVWSYERLKERIQDTCRPDRFRSGLVSFDALPEEIMVGKMGTKALECVRQTAQDGRERATVIRFNPVKDATEIQKTFFLGTESEVGMTFAYQELRDERDFWAGRNQMAPDARLNVLRAQQTVRAYAGKLDLHDSLRMNTPVGSAVRQLYPRWIGTVHSHPSEGSFSPTDVFGFLSSPSRLTDFVGTKSEGIRLMVATTETVWLPTSEREERVARWNEMIHARVSDVRAASSIQAVRDPNLVQRDAIRAFLRTVANKYKFGYYEGDHIGLLERVT